MGSYSERQPHTMGFQSAFRGLKRPLAPSMVRILIAVSVLSAIFIGFGKHHLSSAQDRTALSGYFEEDSHLPDVIIYRRTKKSGSSSMLEEILRETSSYGYVPLYMGGQRLIDVVRAEGLKKHPRRLLVAQHNYVTREFTRGRKTVIMDTFVDGYKQMTSHCRFVLKVSDCDEKLIECLRGPGLKERFYRWAGETHEDDDTFIDIPLSSEYPALSTTVFRHVFPSAVLDIKHRNAANSTCPEDPKIREVYDANYRKLDGIIYELRKRLLTLAGYPTTSKLQSVSLPEILEAAEELEKEKYLKEENLVFGDHERNRGVSQAHKELQRGVDTWGRDENGKVSILRKSDEGKKGREKKTG